MSAKDAIRLVRGRFSGTRLRGIIVDEPVGADFWSPPPEPASPHPAPVEGPPRDYADEPAGEPPAIKWLSLCETVLLISLGGGVAVALWVFFTTHGACG
jgi:hypothetical protein